jgi:ABC-type uncharacterized transport system permease subunit
VSDLLTSDFLTALISGGILAGMPLLFASLGEMVSERAGVLNIGLEGMMLFGAYCGFVAAYYGGSSWLGFAAGAGAGAAVSLIMVVLCVRFGLDQIVVGIAITLAAEGITALIFDSQFAATRPTLGSIDRVSIPFLSDIPVVGGGDSSDGSLFSQPLIVYLAFAFVIVVSWAMRRTHLGLNVRAAGDKPLALDAAGVSVVRTRTWAVLFAGACSRPSSPRAAASSRSSWPCSPAAGRCGWCSARSCSASRSRSRTPCRSPASTSRRTSSSCCPSSP